MFFSSLKQTQTSNPGSETTEPVQSSDFAPSGLRGTLFGKLFSKDSLPYSGPDPSHENEAWAPEAYVGLFRKRRATAEEQLPSANAAQ